MSMVGAPVPQKTVRLLGRYALHGEIAVGGMATVHFGRLHGSVGFQRTVAIKRLHKQYARDPEFVTMFLDEARLAARIRHPNVVPTLDVVATEGELFVVMEYVHGESLSKLIKEEARQGRRIPPRIAASLISGTLQGLHAAHEARDERGNPLNIVHRDVSPQNILIGSDGIARVLDFGVAKAAGRIHTTRQGQIKGKLPYMAPEQLQGEERVSRRVDVYATAVCLWEALTGHRLFAADNEAMVLTKVLHSKVPLPSDAAPNIPPELDEVVMRGLSRDSEERYSSAREMALALERAIPIASTNEVAVWMEGVAGATLALRGNKVAEIEQAQSEVQTSQRLLDEISSTRSALVSNASMSGNAAQIDMSGIDGSMDDAPPPAGSVPSVASSPSHPSNVANMIPPGPGMPGIPGMAGVGYRTPGEASVQSQLSALSMSNQTGAFLAQPPARRGLAVALVILAVLVAVLGGIVLHLSQKDSGPPATAASAEPAPTTTNPASTGTSDLAPAAATTSNTALTPPPLTTGVVANASAGWNITPPANTAKPAASTTATATPTVTVKPPVVAQNPPHVVHPQVTTTNTSTTTTPKKNCDPPYTVDAAGRKRFKVECL